AGEPALVRRLLELRREVVALDAPGPLEPQLPARPLDRSTLPHETDPVLPRPRGPREEHGHEACSAGALEPRGGRVLHLVPAMPQPAGPRAHGARPAGELEPPA